ncbi:MAG: hypothetical protein ABW186_01825 [Rhodanobacteraceae bacterium]
MRGLSRRLAGVCVLFVLLSAPAHAADPVPPGLESWRPWVMRGQEFRACPLIAGHGATEPADFVCAWPGVLEVRADAHGADIAQRWRVDTESLIPLPGDADYWPQQVSVDGQPAPVVDHEGPSVRVGAGAHAIRAHVSWSERPQTLRVPEAVGLVALTVDGKTVLPVQREGEELTLGRAPSATLEADSVDLRVYRKLADGIPALLTTVLELSASGQAREIAIGPALPEGFAPLSLESEEWPARLDADGRMRVQVQPGSTRITLDARALAPLANVAARIPAAPWPQQEIWSYAADSNLRVTSATSALQVDPKQADVPDDWRMLPAFALGDGATITIEERSRGLAPDEKNRLTLDRELWLDFAGDGWFARDRIGGEMLRGWRFDVAAPLTLERASARNPRNAASEGESLLVTRGAEPGSTGVEWRLPAVDLGAGVRIASSSSVLPVAGWRDSFDRVTTRLHLPYGYRLLGAPGADRADGSWFSRWTLLDVFVAAIVALLAWRSFGIAGAAIAIGYLVLAYQESGAPIWTLLATLALGLVAGLLPSGRLATAALWLRRAALALFVLCALPFVADQLRYALHPQLENQGGVISTFGDAQVAGGFARDEVAQGAFRHRGGRVQSESTETPPPPPPEVLESAPESPRPVEYSALKAPKLRRADVMNKWSESTIVQTGAGEPDWNLGTSYALGWTGPVVPGQEVRLVIAPPWLVRALRVALVALLALLVLRLARGAFAFPTRAGAAGLGGATIATLLAFAPRADAQTFPPQNFLDEMRVQLTQPPPCAPECAALANAAVSARGDEIRVVLEAHTAVRVAVPLPSEADGLALRSVSVDGSAQDGVAQSDGRLHVALDRGVHRIELVYAAAADKVALRFALQPMRIDFAGDGWQATGASENRLLTESLSLVRLRESAGTPTPGATQQFAPFVRVTRDISLGLDWTMSTSADALGTIDGGITVDVPTLAGEHVSTSGIKVVGDHVIAAIAEDARSAAWSSTLEKSDTLTLTAPPLAARAEVWRVTASPIWHVEADGVPVSADANADPNDFRTFEFRPLPGEKLTLRITRPQPAEGATRAIERATLVTSAAQRACESELSLTIRASQGGEHVITLPAGAEVTSVTRDSEALNVRPRDGKLALPIVPGRHEFAIRFREALPIVTVAHTPEVDLALPAANLTLGIDLPADRWLLATSGPGAGPAVLYWSELAVLLLVALALSRTRRTPLAFRQWALLVLGFSTFSWIALAIVVAWLFAVDARERRAAESVVVFDLAQIALAGLTAIALVCLVAAIPQGLLGTPDMHVAGNGSSAASLRWFVDRSGADAWPTARAISVPLWAYKAAMLAWAIWLANAVIGWLGWGLAAWTRGGYWRRRAQPIVDIPAPASPPAAP